MLQTPDATVSPISPPLPLTRENLRALTRMSSAGPSTPKKRKASSGKSLTATSQGSSEVPSETQTAIRTRLLTFRITITNAMYFTVEKLKPVVEEIAITFRNSPGISQEKISRVQKKLNDLYDEPEETVSSQLVTELFIPPDSRDVMAPLHFLRNTQFVKDCIPVPNALDDNRLEELLMQTQTPKTPKPDFVFGIDPKRNIFTSQEQTINDLQKSTASIVGGLQYPFFLIEWKSCSTGGNIFFAETQLARSGAAIVSSMVKFYRRAKPSISNEELLQKTLCFSSAVDSFQSRIYVHWWDKSGNSDDWHMHLVEHLGFQDRDPEHFRQYRRIIDNILEWGLGKRLQQIKEALKTL